MKENIVEKINNNIFDFTYEELSFLINDLDTFNILINKYNNNQELYSQYHDYIKQILESVKNEEIEDAIFKSNLCFYFYYYNLLYNGYILYDEELGYLDENRRQTILSLTRQKLFNNELDYDEKYEIPEYLLRMIIEEKRFDILDKFKTLPNVIPDDLNESINQYINETTDELPEIFGPYCHEHNLSPEKYPVNYLYDKYYRTPWIFEKEKVTKIIIDKIKKAEVIITDDPINFSLFSDAGYDISNPKVREEVINLLLDKKLISAYLNELSNEEFIKFKPRIIELINNENKNITYIYSSKRTQIWDDEDIINACIKNKMIGNLYKLYGNYYAYIKNHFYEVIDDVIASLISPYVDSISIEGILENLSTIPEFNDYVYNYWLTHKDDNVCFNTKYFEKSGLLERAVDENQVELFKRIELAYDYSRKSISTKILDYLIKQLNNDEEFYHNFLNSHYANIIDNEELCNYFVSHDEESARKILESLNHQEESLVEYTKFIYDHTKGFLCKDLNITNIAHLDYIAEHFGYDIIRYIENKQIKELTDLNDEDFYKIMDLFKGTFTKKEAIPIYDSFKQLEFAKKNRDITELFTKIKHSIEDKSSKYRELLLIDDYIDDRFFEKYPNLIESKGRVSSYLVSLAEKIIDGNLSEDEEKQYLNIIHTFTNYIIAQSREKFRTTYNLETDCELKFEYDKDELKEYFIKYKLLNSYIVEICRNLHEKYNISNEEAYHITEYYIYKSISTRKFNSIEEKIQYEKMIKGKIGLLIDVVDEFITENNIIINDDFSEAKKVKKNYIYQTKNRVNRILTELSIEQIQKFLLGPENEELYSKLLHLMEKYKMHLLPEYFSDLLDDIDLSSDISDIAGLINYFYKIYELEQKEVVKKGLKPEDVKFNAVSIIRYASAFNSLPLAYRQLLTPEDGKLIKLNPPDNQAHNIKAMERAERAGDQTLKNFERTKVHIPTFNKIISIKSGDKIKKMRVIVGNFTHPSNLTHGERTGACMRIGGAGETLFDFCLNNEFGFHIRFEDAETGEYISRVSGFRNGNSVFLNELRKSCNPKKYTDEEIVDICRITSEIIVKNSNESSFPIDNVFVHRAYATLEDKTCPVISFRGINIKKGLPHFYSDISTFGLLMASSSTPNKEIVLSTELPSYTPSREIPYEGDKKEKISSMVNRINIIKKIQNGEDKTEVNPLIDEDTEIIYGIVNQDYYIYIDKDKNIHEDLIEIDPRAKEELEEARIKINKYLEQLKEQEFTKPQIVQTSIIDTSVEEEAHLIM